MAEQAGSVGAQMAENELRQGLRESGLAWIVEEVDEGLTRIASNEDKPPSAETRIAALIDAMVLAFELAENTADGVSSLLGPEDAPADRLSAITAIEFVDPLGREATRTLSRDRKMGEDTMNLLRARAEELRAAIQGNSLQ